MDLFVVTAPGLEAITGAEVRALGFEGGAAVTGGIQLTAGPGELYRLALHLGTASGILVRIGALRARSLGELERRAAELPWDRVLGGAETITFDVTARKSRLYHTGAIAERLGRAAMGAMPGVAVEDAPDALRFVARIVRDELVLSADAVGEPLHRRGYRIDPAKAPLRETLAAALLAAAGWSPSEALVDPMCGAGTIPIEAARRARGIPPGWERRFAFEGWSDFDRPLWKAARAEAEAGIRARAPAPVEGSDRDAGAIRASEANAERAGVSADIRFRTRALSDAAPPPGWDGPGWLVTNPPYGQRVGRVGPLRDLYARLGQVARDRFPRWGLALLTATPLLAGQVAPGAETPLTTRNGNLPVRLYRWPPPTA